MVATTVGGVKNYKEIRVEICGYEKVDLILSLGSVPYFWFNKNDGGGSVTLNNVAEWFSVDSIHCLVILY